MSHVWVLSPPAPCPVPVLSKYWHQRMLCTLVTSDLMCVSRYRVSGQVAGTKEREKKIIGKADRWPGQKKGKKNNRKSKNNRSAMSEWVSEKANECVGDWVSWLSTISIVCQYSLSIPCLSVWSGNILPVCILPVCILSVYILPAYILPVYILPVYILPVYILPVYILSVYILPVYILLSIYSLSIYCLSIYCLFIYCLSIYCLSISCLSIYCLSTVCILPDYMLPVYILPVYILPVYILPVYILPVYIQLSIYRWDRKSNV